ncbi:MAG TPA: YggS family pyridoxal phosphate-dependent enzyme [Acholeplasmataceae bacterium]|jgi:pyridoxal phosphate enzyme (YggS family)|nr:YggS family pyridoxal phosphate-dependent enzyme [Acholeplasmataceae bacterium]
MLIFYLRGDLVSIAEKVAEVKKTLVGYDNVKLVAATKYLTIEQTKELVEAGITDLGENRTDLFLEKYNALKDYDINWHFFGVVQSRKVKDIANRISCLHSLDRLSIAMELDRRLTKPLDCFVQINISEESNKQGIPLSQTKKFIKSLAKCTNIRVIGLMCIGKLTCEEDVLHEEFAKMQKMQKEIQEMNLDYAPCHELSMGMSNDYLIALEHGATYIRLGRIFLE